MKKIILIFLLINASLFSQEIKCPPSKKACFIKIDNSYDVEYYLLNYTKKNVKFNCYIRDYENETKEMDNWSHKDFEKIVTIRPYETRQIFKIDKEQYKNKYYTKSHIVRCYKTIF